MKFTVIVSAAPSQNASKNALEFCRALLKAKHTINTLFFLSTGVQNGNKSCTLHHQWEELIQAGKLNALCCSNSAIKNALADSSGNALPLLNSSFEIAGLGQLVASTKACDRVITFGEQQKASDAA